MAEETGGYSAAAAAAAAASGKPYKDPVTGRWTDIGKVSTEVWHARKEAHQCVRCGGTGHFVFNCPAEHADPGSKGKMQKK